MPFAPLGGNCVTWLDIAVVSCVPEGSSIVPGSATSPKALGSVPARFALSNAAATVASFG